MNVDDCKELLVFYCGEVMLQENVGLVEKMVELGLCVVCCYMLEQYCEFFIQFFYLVVGVFDLFGQLWVIVFDGVLGFIQLLQFVVLIIVAQFVVMDLFVDVLQVGVLVGLFGFQVYMCCCNCVNGFVL